MSEVSALSKLSALNKIRVLKAFWGVAKDIEQTDDIFALSEKVPDEVFESYIVEMEKNPRIRESFQSRHIIEQFDLDSLFELPRGTLGHEYAAFMKARGLAPDFYPKRESLTKAGYFRLHVYQTHDIWHILTGFSASPPGELGLMAFYYKQFPLPTPILVLSAGILNILLAGAKDGHARLEGIGMGWNLGRSSEPLFGVNWENYWETPLSEIRKEFKINVVGSESFPSILLENENESELQFQMQERARFKSAHASMH